MVLLLDHLRCASECDVTTLSLPSPDADVALLSLVALMIGVPAATGGLDGSNGAVGNSVNTRLRSVPKRMETEIPGVPGALLGCASLSELAPQSCDPPSPHVVTGQSARNGVLRW